MAFDDYPSYQPPTPPLPEPEQKKSRGCLFTVVALVVVLALVASSVGGAIWLLRQRLASMPVPEQVVAAPTVDVAVTAEMVRETAVPTTTTPLPNMINRIAIINPDGQVETMAPDGSARRLLTDIDRRFQFPAWSPDGRQIAAIGANRAGSGIYLLDDSDEVAAGDPLQIYRESNYNPFYLYWSPNGSQISFLASHLSRGMSLNLIPAAAGGDRAEVLNGSPIYWQWTASGDQILLHAGFTGNGSRLTFFDLDAAETDRDDIAPPGFFQAPGISADGRFLAYAEATAGNFSQLVIDDTESGARQDIRHAGQVAMSWSPAGNYLAFTNGAPDSDTFWGPLQLFEAETGNLRLLSTALVIGYFWSPDGRYIATISAPNSSGDIIARAEWGYRDIYGRSAKQLAQNHNFAFELSVIDVESGQGRKLADFEPTFLFLSQFLPFFDQYALSHRIWAPDSSALVLPVLEDRVEKLYIIPRDGSPRQFLTNGDIAFWSQQ